MNIGFIGTGVISEAVVTGLCTAVRQPAAVWVSPRNAERAQTLAEKFNHVTVAGDNQAVIDNTDIVCLAVRPQSAEDVLSSLSFRSEQVIVSFIATFPSQNITRLVGPVATVCRMVPLPTVARHQGPIVLSPPVPEVASLFGQLGTLIQVDDDEQLIALWTVTALMAPFFRFLETPSKWLNNNGIGNESACRYMGSMIHALSATAMEKGTHGYAHLIHEHATPQGLNEQALRELKNMGWNDQITEVLDLIHDRLNGRADFDDSVK